MSERGPDERSDIRESIAGLAPHLATLMRATPSSLSSGTHSRGYLVHAAATMCGELGLSKAGISLCLDHQANKDENGKPLPAVIRKVYNLATRARVAKKREVLDGWAVELRRIIGEPATQVETGLA